MVSTRSASSSPVKRALPSPTERPPASPTKRKATAPSHPHNEPLRLLVAPKNLSQLARIIVLPNPTNKTSPNPTQKRFLFCPRTGLFELTKITVPQHDPRSILFSPSDTVAGSHTQRLSVDPAKKPISSGYISEQATYMTATPFDLVFLLLPVLESTRQRSALFQSVDDILEEALTEDKHFMFLFNHARPLLDEAMSRICDSVDAGDEKMYRYSLDKTLATIVAKARHVVQRGLPESLEERFVTTALEVPVLSVRREESSISVASTLADMTDVPVSNEVETTTSESASDSFDSQSTAASSVAPSAVSSELSFASSVTTAVEVEVEVTATAPAKDDGPSDKVKALQRLRTAFSFITASYTSPQLGLTLSEELDDSANSGVDFAPLNQHLEQIQKLKAEAAAAHSFSNAGRKRGLEDEEEAEMRAEKKKRLEEEEKRKKANQSRGVRDLAKVNVKGMKKMSDFFGKKPAAKT